MEKRLDWKDFATKFSSIVLVIVLLCLFSQNSKSFAANSDGQPGGKEVVFVLDTSGSMKSNDPNRLAIDSIAQLVYTLPTNYKVGLVAYNTDTILALAPVEDSQRETLMNQVGTVAYDGYSNAGTGLTQAVNLLIADKAKDKTIIFLSDGEIKMKSDDATAQSLAAYQAAVAQAIQNDITVHVIGLGPDMENTDNSIFAAAAQTGGEIYHTPHAVGIQNAISSILEDKLQIRQTTAAIMDTDGSMENLSVDIPFAHASKVRVLLAGNTEIKNLNTNFQADSAKQINGKRYSLIEMAYPTSDKMILSFSGTPGSRIQVTVIPEYSVLPKAEVTYADQLPTADQPQDYYDREATITYKFYDAQNPNVQLWTEAYFNHGKLPVNTGDALEETALENGSLAVTVPVAKSGIINCQVDYSKLSVNVIGTNQLSVDLEGPPAVPPKKPPYGLFALAAAVLICIGAAIWYVRRPKPVLPPSEDKPEPSKYSYVGKLNIYVTRSPSGYDIAPLSYNLFRLPSTKVISLGEILESCNVKEQFIGADRIYFKSGAGRSLILTNNSDCTVMKSREILMKKKSYQLPVDAKVDVTFEDEIGELTFQYKDLKPSEM